MGHYSSSYKYEEEKKEEQEFEHEKNWILKEVNSYNKKEMHNAYKMLKNRTELNGLFKLIKGLNE